MANDAYYPPVGFYFKVSIDGFPDSESAFQEVTGLSMSMETTTLREGGVNNFQHALPNPPKSEPLILKRGLRIGSELASWCKETIEEFTFRPKNLHVFLLRVDPEEPETKGAIQPLMTWHIIHAFPTKWEISGFNAMQNELAIETVQLSYNYFHKRS